MYRYIKAELYRNFKRKSYWIFLALGITYMLLVPITTMAPNHSAIEVYFIGLIVSLSFIAVIISGILSSLVQKSKQVQCNLLASGITRAKIYFFDYLTINVLTIITIIIFFSFSMIIGKFLFQESLMNDVVFHYLYFIGFTSCFFLAFNSIALFANTIFNHKGVAMSFYYGVCYISMLITMAAKLKYIYRLIPTVHVMDYSKSIIMEFPFVWNKWVYLSLAGNVVLFLSLGYLLYRKKEY